MNKNETIKYLRTRNYELRDDGYGYAVYNTSTGGRPENSRVRPATVHALINSGEVVRDESKVFTKVYRAALQN